MEVLGIDVSKNQLHAALLAGDHALTKTVPNSKTGITQLQRWLENRKNPQVHACLEATGGWSEAVATALHESGHVVSLVNPTRVKALAQSEMLRIKTDRVDAGLIARFCRMHVPEPWSPPAPEIQELQALVRRHEALLRLRADEENRLDAPTLTLQVRKSISGTVAHFDRQITRIEAAIEDVFKRYPGLRQQRDLLVTIPGIGRTTAARIIGEMPNIVEFRGAKAVGAYAGLSPRHYESGNIRWPSRLSKSGNANLRKALYFPAVTAVRFNPVLKSLAERLRARGKSNMVIIAAAMGRLLVLAYGVLKSGQAFNPHFATA